MINSSKDNNEDTVKNEDIKQPSSNEEQQNWENILKNNPTYKKTYNNTGYLYIGDIGIDVSNASQDEINSFFSRYKQKQILVPKDENFTINKKDFEVFLEQIKADYKIDNIHFVLQIHGSKDSKVHSSVKLVKYYILKDKSVMIDIPREMIESLLQLFDKTFDNDMYIYITSAPCYDNDLLLGDKNNNQENKKLRDILIDFTKTNKKIKFLLSHHNDSKILHTLRPKDKINGDRSFQHIDDTHCFQKSSMQYEVIENGEMHTITKEEKNRIFYSPENRITHDTIRPQDVLNYIDGDYTFLDKNGNSKGKIRDVIGVKDENEYTFDDLATDIVNTYEQTKKIRFLKRGYFKPFYDAIKKNYNKDTKEISQKLIQNFHDIEDTIKCTCASL